MRQFNQTNIEGSYSRHAPGLARSHLNANHRTPGSVREDFVLQEQAEPAKKPHKLRLGIDETISEDGKIYLSGVAAIRSHLDLSFDVEDALENPSALGLTIWKHVTIVPPHQNYWEPWRQCILEMVKVIGANSAHPIGQVYIDGGNSTLEFRSAFKDLGIELHFMKKDDANFYVRKQNPGVIKLLEIADAYASIIRIAAETNNGHHLEGKVKDCRQYLQKG
jgi:hypothetical protein